MQAAAKKSITCPVCDARYKVPANVSARSVTCRRCGERFSLETPSSAPAPAQGAVGGARRRRVTTGSSRRPSPKRTRSRPAATTAVGMCTRKRKPAVRKLVPLLGLAALGAAAALFFG